MTKPTARAIGSVLVVVALVGGVVPLSASEGGDVDAADESATEYPLEMCDPRTIEVILAEEPMDQPHSTIRPVEMPDPVRTDSASGDDSEQALDQGAATSVQPEESAPQDEEFDALLVEECQIFVHAILSPLMGPARVTSQFGALRDGGARRHHGIDLPAPKMTPVVAAASGEVAWVADGAAGTRCCAIAITHEDGWKSIYLHLNNDTFGTDDGSGRGVAPGLRTGDPINAGQVIGYVGDSGNAENAAPHLHFELHMPDGTPIDAAGSLVAGPAPVESESDDPTMVGSSMLAGPRSAFEGAYVDDDLLPQARFIDMLASRGIVDGCGELLQRFCPNEPLTGIGAMAWLRRAVPTFTSSIKFDYGVDRVAVERQLLEAMPVDIELSVLRGCGLRRFCEKEPMTIGEAIALLVHVFDVALARGEYFYLDNASPFSMQIGGLSRTGVVGACSHPGAATIYPDRLVTRAWFAEVLGRLIEQEPTGDCTNVR